MSATAKSVSFTETVVKTLSDAVAYASRIYGRHGELIVAAGPIVASSRKDLFDGKTLIGASVTLRSDAGWREVTETLDANGKGTGAFTVSDSVIANDDNESQLSLTIRSMDSTIVRFADGFAIARRTGKRGPSPSKSANDADSLMSLLNPVEDSPATA